ncbi:MAG: hypothetical protein WA816_09395 [Bacteroidales bacterium]
MKRIICFLNLLLMIVFNAFSQTWVVAKQYKDEWGDKTGQQSIEQKVEGSYGWNEDRIIVKISRDVPSTDKFTIMAYDLNGKPYEYFDLNPVRVENGPSKKVLEKNPFMDPTTYPGAKVIENKYLIKYKIGNSESSFYISKPSGIFKNRLYFEIDYSKFNTVLLSTSVPIKCLIAEEIEDFGTVKVSNLFRFTIYPSNYKQLVR